MAGLPLVGDEFAGYRMRAVLGRGGMSVVYQAENLRLSSVIALKVLAPELAADDVFRARFLEESRIAASLNHPNVIPIYDMGSQDELLYIAMRYVSGTDLRQMIKKRGRLPPETALFLLGQAARALDAAHRKGLVHRDVKPGNLLIERGSDEGDPDHVYLADFGITKHAMSRTGLTSTGQFLGTIDYVAPEQIRGTSVLGLADQYSLGCVLYECLTGRVPFEKDLDAAIIWAHVEETPAMPTALRPELPPEVDEVFGRVLAKRPDERYGSCREFIDAARMALGIFGRARGRRWPTASRPPGRRPALRPAAGRGRRRTSSPGATVASRSHPPAPAVDRRRSPPLPAGRSGAGQSGGTLASHRRDYGSRARASPASPPALRRPGRAAGTALVPAAALDRRAGGCGPAPGGAGHLGRAERFRVACRGPTMPAMSPKPKPKPATSALMAAIILANKSADAQGLLPPSTCKQASATHVTCTAPVAGITGVVFQTFPNQQALYTAYTAEVSSLNPGRSGRTSPTADPRPPTARSAGTTCTITPASTPSTR